MARTPGGPTPTRPHLPLPPSPAQSGVSGGADRHPPLPDRRKRKSLSSPHPSAVLTSPSKSQVPAVPPTSTSGPSQVPLTRGSWSYLGPPRSVGSWVLLCGLWLFSRVSPRVASYWIPVRFSAVCAPRAPTKTTVGPRRHQLFRSLPHPQGLQGNQAFSPPPGLGEGT